MMLTASGVVTDVAAQFTQAVGGILRELPWLSEVFERASPDIPFQAWSRGGEGVPSGGVLVATTLDSAPLQVIERIQRLADAGEDSVPVQVMLLAMAGEPDQSVLAEAQRHGVTIWGGGELRRLASQYGVHEYLDWEKHWQRSPNQWQPQASSNHGSLTLEVVVDDKAWFATDVDAFVLPVGVEVGLRGGTARAVLASLSPARRKKLETAIRAGQPPNFGVLSPYPVKASKPLPPNVIIATAYGRQIDPEEAVVAAVRLAARLGVRVLALPLLGASTLGAPLALRRVVDGINRLPAVTMTIRLVVVSVDLAIEARRLLKLDPQPGKGGGLPTDVNAVLFNDAADGEDQLGIDAQARTFAQMLAARSVKTPLAIGLFGKWGSGKSFFMQRIRAHMTELAKGPQAGDSDNDIYYRGITPITFNAWHYTDSDLWSSLALRIFNGVAARLAGRKEDEEVDAATITQRRELAQSIASNERDRTEAQQQRQSAIAARAEAVGKRAEAEASRWQWRDGLTLDKVKGIDVQAVEEALEALGHDKAKATLGMAVQAAADAGSLGQRLDLMFPGLRAWLWAPLRPWLGLLLAVVAAGLAYGVFEVAAWVAGGVFAEGWLRDAVASITVLFGGWQSVAQRLARARQGTDALIQAADRLRAAWAEGAVADTEVAKLNEFDAAIMAADSRIAQCDQAIDEASRRLRQIESGALVYEFLQERSSDNRYRDRLGVVTLLRHDLETLEKKLEAVNQGKDFPVQRIVLYIDDLDRCEPDRVVDVLQAVHLLLAFPLFAVIVAVDPRWLERSLYKRYLPGFEDMNEDERAASEFSPHNYLEKIFQIPYRVPGMSADGFGQLVAHLVDNGGHRAAAGGGAGKARSATAQNAAAAERTAEDTEAGDATVKGDTEPAENTNKAPDPAGAATSDPAETVAVPLRLVLDAVERDFLGRLHAFAPTPRSVKRLVNTYILLRLQLATQGGETWQRFAEGGYRWVALLLAMDVGFPMAMRVLRHQLSLPAATGALTAAVSRLAGECAVGPVEVRRQCEELGAALAALGKLKEVGTLPSAPDLKRWLEPVGRFCFHAPSSLDVLKEEERAAPQGA